MKICSLSSNINNINFKAKLSNRVNRDIIDSQWFMGEINGKDSLVYRNCLGNLEIIKTLCPDHKVYKKCYLDKDGSICYDLAIKKLFGKTRTIGARAINDEDLYSEYNIMKLRKLVEEIDTEEKYNDEFQRRMRYKRKRFYKNLFGLK